MTFCPPFVLAVYAQAKEKKVIKLKQIKSMFVGARRGRQ